MSREKVFDHHTPEARERRLKEIEEIYKRDPEIGKSMKKFHDLIEKASQGDDPDAMKNVLFQMEESMFALGQQAVMSMMWASNISKLLLIVLEKLGIKFEIQEVKAPDIDPDSPAGKTGIWSGGGVGTS